jgi:hypothetical protein
VFQPGWNNQACGFMKHQIEFNFSGNTKACLRRRSRRAKWAHLWFTRMHEVIDAAGDQTAKPASPEDAPKHFPTDSIKHN